MSANPARGILIRIEKIRSRVLICYGLLGASASFALAILTSQITKADPIDPNIYWLAAGLGCLCLAACWIAHRRLIMWSARLMATAFVVIPTLMVVIYNLPHEVALSTFTAALLATAVGATYIDTIALTAVVVILGLFAMTPSHTVEETVAVQVSVATLLLTAGISLAWLQAGIQRGVLSLEASQAHFQRLSYVDTLTGLGNRRQFDLSIAETLSRASENFPAALILLDMNNLKRINDRYTHPVGDKALQMVADMIRGSTRGSDISCRIGGDEFAIILPTGGLRGANRIATRITRKLQSAKLDDDLDVRVSVSIGIALTDDSKTDSKQLLAAADADLYSSRHNSRQTATSA